MKETPTEKLFRVALRGATREGDLITLGENLAVRATAVTSIRAGGDAGTFVVTADGVGVLVKAEKIAALVALVNGPSVYNAVVGPKSPPIVVPTPEVKP